MDPAGPGPAASIRPPARPGGGVPATASRTELARLRQVAQDFESIFLTTMLKTMRASLPAGGVFPEGTATKTYQGFMDEELGKTLARGGGIGLADVLYREVTRRLPGVAPPSSPGPALPIAPGEGVGPRSTEERPPQ